MLQQSTNKRHTISHLHIHNYIQTVELLHVSRLTGSSDITSNTFV